MSDVNERSTKSAEMCFLRAIVGDGRNVNEDFREHTSQ
jgi:hypothetical protein